MRRPLTAVFMIAAATMALAGGPGWAQQLPGLKPPPPPPIKAYQPLAVTPPAPLNDPSFVAFRNQLGQIVSHKDRAGLGKLVVAQNFFWIQDKDVADAHKSGIDNLVEAVGLDARTIPVGRYWPVLPTNPRRRSRLSKRACSARRPTRISIPTLSKNSSRQHKPIPASGAIPSKTASRCTPRRSPILR